MLSRRVAFRIVVVWCAGLIVSLPLGDRQTSLAADPPRARAKAQPQLPNSLAGRITDENGAPVADAELQMYRNGGGRGYMAKTKADGSYALERVEAAGVYRLSILSSRCISLSDYQDENLHVRLDPPKTMTRDFVLKLACQLRLTVVDEDGRPVPTVTVYKPGR
ncbi:MAG TPA: carboxypeptidase-like regulatory domain-containing protein, partial [Planctomycetaceae bacterium]|nr:carboxypeptidase-like regulatory domain-containing protein [Planctomycetaceae bacterium]